MEIDGRAAYCSFVLVSKVRNYGGDFEIAQSTSLLDDRFEVVLFESRQFVPIPELPGAGGDAKALGR